MYFWWYFMWFFFLQNSNKNKNFEGFDNYMKVSHEKPTCIEFCGPL